MDNLGLTLDDIPFHTILQAEIAKDMILIKNIIKYFFLFVHRLYIETRLRTL